MAARQWTEEQKKAQAEKIREYKPWLISTGPTSDEGKKKVSQNALKEGDFTREKVALRKALAKRKSSWSSGDDKRYAWNRSIKYKGALFGLFKSF